MNPKIRLIQSDVSDLTKFLSTETSTVCKTTKQLFHLVGCSKNPEYVNGLIEIPSFDTCLIGSKGTKIGKLKTRPFIVKTRPKWLTDLGYYDTDTDTGELLGKGVYQTNEIKKSNGKKIKALDAFCDHYEDAYRKKKISIMFHTFTRPNASRLSLKTMIKLVKKRYKSIGYEVTGHIWTAEVTETGRMWHYHLAVALDKRMNVRGASLPKKLMLEDLWGQRTEVEFVKQNIRHYMAKYFAKHNARVIGSRSFGRSRNFV